MGLIITEIHHPPAASCHPPQAMPVSLWVLAKCQITEGTPRSLFFKNKPLMGHHSCLSHFIMGRESLAYADSHVIPSLQDLCSALIADSSVGGGVVVASTENVGRRPRYVQLVILSKLLTLLAPPFSSIKQGLCLDHRAIVTD